MFCAARESFDYAPFYCEENVWRLLGRSELALFATWAAIVSNPSRSVATLHQRAARAAAPPYTGRAERAGPIMWDYHVLALASDEEGSSFALDLDSELPFPCPLARYLAESFPSGFPPDFAPLFRLIPSADYRVGLVSDRSHMRREDGSWLQEPPPWPAPGEGSGRKSVLMDWIAMDRPGPGAIFDATALAAHRGGLPRAGGDP